MGINAVERTVELNGPSDLWARRRRTSSLTVELPASGSAPGTDHLRSTYDLEKVLGRGAVGTVYKATRRADARQVVVKVRNVIDDKEVSRSCRHEFEVLKNMTHQHIIRALDFLEQDGETALILEYCCEETLHSIVKQTYPGGLPEERLKPLSLMLCEAVDYLHGRRIVHRDIKPANVLVSDDLNRLWLADFNTAYQLMDGWALSMTGTMDFAAPEVLQDESPSEKADIWSLGLSLYFMALGKLPRKLGDFHGNLTAFAAAVSKPLTFEKTEWQFIDGSVKELIQQCLTVEKSYRPSTMELLDQIHENGDGDHELSVRRTSSI